MFWSRISASHGIAVKWYLRVYWQLPFSIVDSFKKHRRFFCLAPWILGSVNQLHFPKDSFPAFSGFFFSSSTEIADSLAESYWINRHLPTRPSCFCWQNGHIGHAELESFVGPCQDMCLNYWRMGINETESLPWLAPCKKGNDSGIYSTCHFLPHLKSSESQSNGLRSV